MYNLDAPSQGVQDCPKCRHTMTFLSGYNAIERNEGYLIDDGTDNNTIIYLLFGWTGVLLKFLYRHTLQPLYYQTLGKRRQRRYAEIVHAFPNTLICPHCSHILRRK